MAATNQSKNPNLPNGYVSKGGADGYNSRDSYQTTPAYMTGNQKAFHVRVHANNDAFEPGKKMTVMTNKTKTFENFLEECTQKVKPPFGAARRLYTARGRHRIDRLDDLEEGSIYVITGNEKFKHCNYREISERRVPRRSKGFKKIDIDRIYTPVTHAVDERYRKKSGRSQNWGHQRKGMMLKVHVNNECHKPVFPITIRYTDVSDMNKILIAIEQALGINPIERVFKIQNQGCCGFSDYTEIHGAEELVQDDHILVIPRYSVPYLAEPYLFTGKPGFKVSTSPRPGHYLFDSLGSSDKSYKHKKSLNRHKPVPSIGSSKQSDSHSPFSNAGSQGGRRNNQKSRTRQVDYDKDNGGVFRAKKQNNARGAQQVNETRETRTEKPIDQMEAEIVEEEEINTKDKTTPIPPGTELNKQPSKETKQNADSQTKKSSQVKKDAKTDKRNNVSVLPPLISDSKQTAESDINKKSDKQDVNSVKDGQVKDAVKKIENDTDTKNVKVNAGNKPVDQKSGTDKEIEQVQGSVTPSGIKANNTKVENSPGAVTPSGTKSNSTKVENNPGAVTPSGTKSNKTEPSKSPVPASPQEGKISRGSQTTKERMNEDDGMHQNDEFADESFNRSGYDRNTPGGPSKDMRSSTPASRGESRRKQLQKENEAAAKIQAGARGYKTRKEFNAKKESMQRDKEERNRNKQENDMRRQAEEDERRRQADAQQGSQKKAMDEDLAASKIQASFKGYKTRKEMDVKKKQQGQK